MVVCNVVFLYLIRELEFFFPFIWCFYSIQFGSLIFRNKIDNFRYFLEKTKENYPQNFEKYPQ